MTAADVERAADALLRAGERPTVEKIRARLGSGSPNTVTPLLDAWWKRLAARLDAGPAALQRLPPVVAHVAEALWLQALDEARARVALEQKRERAQLDQEKLGIEVKSSVLTLREAELEDRLKAQARTIETLEAQVKALTRMLAKEQAAREHAEQRQPVRKAAPAVGVQSKRAASRPSPRNGSGKATPRPKRAHAKPKAVGTSRARSRPP